MFVDCQKYFLVIQLKFGTVRHFLPVTVMYATHLVALIKIYRYPVHKFMEGRGII
jgi:hypothetical protein